MTMRRARKAHKAHEQAILERGRMANPPTAKWALKPGFTYCCFLSHFKQEAGSDARYLRDLIIAMCGAPAFLDSVNLTNLETLFEDGVRPSEVVVALATAGCTCALGLGLSILPHPSLCRMRGCLVE